MCGGKGGEAQRVGIEIREVTRVRLRWAAMNVGPEALDLSEMRSMGGFGAEEVAFLAALGSKANKRGGAAAGDPGQITG